MADYIESPEVIWWNVAEWAAFDDITDPAIFNPP